MTRCGQCNAMLCQLESMENGTFSGRQRKLLLIIFGRKGCNSNKLDSHLCQAPWTLNDFYLLSCEVYFEVSFTPFKLQLKPPLTFPDPYYLFLSPSENFQLHEILPEVLLEVPPVVLLDVHLEVHFEFLTSSDYIWVIPTHPKSILSFKVCVEGGENQK